MKFNELNEVITSAYSERKDVFVAGCSLPAFCELTEQTDGVRTIVLLPADLYETKEENVAVYARADTIFDKPASLCLANVHLMQNEEFCRFIEREGYRRIIISFAELADENEYGTDRGYRWTSEWRCSTLYNVQLVCLFSVPVDAELYRNVYGSLSPVYIDVYRKTHARIINCNEKEKNRYLIKEATKKAGQKSLVLFPTRTQAEEFARTAASEGIRCALITGATDKQATRQQTGSFYNNRLSLIAGTKSALSLFPIVRADNVIISGVPYSAAHLERCSLMGLKTTVIFSDADVIRQLRLIEQYAENYCGEAASEIREYKMRLFEEILSDIV